MEAGLSSVESEAPKKFLKKATDAAPSKVVRLEKATPVVPVAPKLGFQKVEVKKVTFDSKANQEPAKRVNFIQLNKQRIATQSAEARNKTKSQQASGENIVSGLISTIKSKLGFGTKPSASKEEIKRSRSANSCNDPTAEKAEKEEKALQ